MKVRALTLWDLVWIVYLAPYARMQYCPGLYCSYSGRGEDLLAIPYADVLLPFVGETTELCKWTVDLGSLPPFQQFAQSQQGFYTGSCSSFHLIRHLFRTLTEAQSLNSV
jgi:hypothetical protein